MEVSGVRGVADPHRRLRYLSCLFSDGVFGIRSKNVSMWNVFDVTCRDEEHIGTEFASGGLRFVALSLGLCEGHLNRRWRGCTVCSPWVFPCQAVKHERFSVGRLGRWEDDTASPGHDLLTNQGAGCG